nr:hypothetical protein [Tanacetum cinerariifolium]
MRRVGKGFSGVKTSLFKGMLVGQEIEEEGGADEHVEDVTAGDDAHGDDLAAHGDVQQTPPQSPQAIDACDVLTRRVEHLEYDKVAQALEITKLKRRVKKLEKRNKGRMIDDMDKEDDVVLMDDKEEDKKVEKAKVVKNESEPAEVQEVVDVVTTGKLITQVVIATSATIPTAEPKVPVATLTAAPAKVAAAPSRRRKGVVIKDPKEESTTSEIIPAKTKSKDKGKGILVEELKPLKKKQQIKVDEEYARKLHAELNKDIDWDVAIDHVKLKDKEDLVVQRYQAMKRKPQKEAQARKNMMMYLKNIVGFKLDYFKGMSYDDIQKAAKRRKLNEEVEDLKRHLKIVPDEDDDVYTEATPLERKNFDREDLEALWNLVKERCTCSSLEESKDCTWLSKGQELEATGIMWCAYHNLYNHTDDFVSRKKVPTLKVYSRPDAECFAGQMTYPVASLTLDSARSYVMQSIPTANDEFPLPDYFPTVSEDRFPLLNERNATTGEVCTADEVKNEHYALWEVIEFGDSYEAPKEASGTGSESEGSAKKKRRTVTVTTEDMQKRRNDVKARTTLLLAFPDEHQLRFSKYKTAQELWAAILKTFGGNEATKKTKKNQLKHRYGNFKAEGKDTLEQTFNRLRAIVSHPQFMDIEIEQDDLNQKFLTSLTPKWLMYTIVWRNRSILDMMSLDDLYNHLKVYEPEVQKKSESNSHNMDFISSAKNNTGKEEVNTTSFPTASTQVSPASANVAAATFSHDTVCAYIASQSNSSQIKYEDINQIDENDIKEMDIKWNMALLSHFARECRAPRSQDKGRRENFKQDSKTEEQTPKALMAIDRVGWDWSYMANEEENHALVADQEAPTEFALMSKSSSENEKMIMKGNEKYNETLIALTPILSVEDKRHYKLRILVVGIPTANDEFPLPDYFPTVSEDRFPLLNERNATTGEVCTADEVKNEHYALWEVIEFGDSYEAPKEASGTGSESEGSAKKKRRTVTVTTEDMQKRRNDVKARTTLLLAFPDEHQLRFSKYKTAQELWAAILKTFGGNEATKKTKKNQLKHRYGNFKAEGKDTLEQTFNRLRAIVSHPQFMDIEIEQDDLNQKFLTSLTPKWLMYTIVWRNRSILDMMSLDDLYNHLKVYEPEVQKKSESNSHNMDFISSAKNNTGKEEVNTTSFPTASTQKKTGKKITIQGTDVAGFDKSKVEFFNCHKIGHFARECRAPRSQDKGRRENFKQDSKTEEQTPKALMAIDRVGWDWSYMANEEENHALVADQEAPTEFALMSKSSSENEVFDNSLCSKACKKNTDSLNTKITELSEKLSDSKTMLYHYKLDNSNYLPQPQYENYLCNLCGNNSHDGYDCQQQFSLVYEQEPSYNQNYNDNYYPHDLPSFPCCDNRGESHETFQCQSMDQNIDFSGSDQIQTPQYPDVHPPSQEISDEVFQAKGDLMKSIQTFLEEFNYIPFEEKPKILLQAWDNFFTIQHAQPWDSNELFQKLLEDLKELAEYKESLENPSNEIAASNSNQDIEGPPQDSDIRQLIREECCIEVCEEQKQNMENTILELVEICRQKELFCMYDNVESALNSKLLLINLNSQRLDKKNQEVKNVVEQSTERRTRIEESLQNFKVILKSSNSLKDTSQISLVHAVAPILSTREPKYSPSMGYEHPNTTSKTESDEIIKSGVEELIPILSKNEVTSEDKRECDVLVCENSLICDDHSEIFSDSNNDDDISSDDHDFEDVEYVEASLPDPEIISVEEENTRSSNTTTHADDSFPEYDSFCFEIEPAQERLINAVKNDISNDSSNDPLLEEADLFLAFDNSIPPGIENFAYDSEGDIHFLEGLLIDDSIPYPNSESPESDFDNPSFPRSPLEPPNADFELDEGEDISFVMNDSDELECLDLRDEFDHDYSSFMFVICSKMFLSFLSAESEDTIFDPGISV